MASSILWGSFVIFQTNDRKLFVRGRICCLLCPPWYVLKNNYLKCILDRSQSKCRKLSGISFRIQRGKGTPEQTIPSPASTYRWIDIHEYRMCDNAESSSSHQYILPISRQSASQNETSFWQRPRKF
jgi:hypothetical protein